MSHKDTDWKGISKIENFLDTIEDVDAEVLDNFQSKFSEILKKYKGINGSKEYQKNEALTYSMKEDRGVVKNGKTNDGVDECLFRGTLDNFGCPTGAGTLVYSATESFTGTFDNGSKFRYNDYLLMYLTTQNKIIFQWNVYQTGLV